MMELAPYLFLLLAVGLAGTSMRFVLELKKHTLVYERHQAAVRRRIDEHLSIIQDFETKIETIEADLEKYQGELADLQLQHKEATTHLNDLEAKEERLHPTERRIDMGAEDE